MAQKSLARLIVQPFAIAVVLAILTRLVMQFHTIPSASMAPTLLPGDRVLVTRYLPGSAPKAGDVVVFRSPADGRSLLVKRIVATEGDYVDSVGATLRVGGRAAAEPYLQPNTRTGSIQPQIIPRGRYFVLGDNRAASMDSRDWGPLAGELIVGRARMVLWQASQRGTPPAERPRRVFKWVR